MRRPPAAPLPPGFSTVWVTVAVQMTGFGIVIPIVPLYAKRFHASSLTATLLIAAYSAAALVSAPLWGRLSDRVGRRPVLLVSLAGTAAASVLTGFAGTLAMLFAARLIDGVSGSTVPVAQALAGDLAPEDQRARLFGLLGAAFGLGFVAGPAIGALAAIGGPRLPFLVAGAIAALNTLVAWRRVPETHHAGVAPAGPVEESEDGDGATRRGGGIGWLLGVSFCAMSAFSAFEATLALFGHRHFGLTIGSSAATFAAFGVLMALVQGAAVHPVVARIGEVPALRAGLAADAAGLVLLGAGGGWVTLVPALAVLTCGQALVQSTMAATLSGRVAAHRRGQALGWQQASGGLGRVAGPALGGALLGASASGAPFVVGGVLCAAACLMTLAIREAAPVRRSASMLP